MAKVGRISKGTLTELKLFFWSDPGRRNRSFVGVRHLNNILSVHVISKDILFARFGASMTKSYWGMIRPDGSLMNIEPELSNILHSNAWFEPQVSILRGNIC